MLENKWKQLKWEIPILVNLIFNKWFGMGCAYCMCMHLCVPGDCAASLTPSSSSLMPSADTAHKMSSPSHRMPDHIGWMDLHTNEIQQEPCQSEKMSHYFIAELLNDISYCWFLVDVLHGPVATTRQNAVIFVNHSWSLSLSPVFSLETVARLKNSQFSKL